MGGGFGSFSDPSSPCRCCRPLFRAYAVSAQDREVKLEREIRELAIFYRDVGKPQTTVTLFAEDYDFLEKRGRIQYGRAFGVRIKRGDPKRRPRRKRPPEMQL